ncbi:hypothetical protein RvY_17676 [Ramazzottius varieornatus]|uniref:F-box domain-containing protein n=1 Tax=Ramazzottius varieornatus TaxID=947166 RepID=A0A1D1W3P1_RAMVA|nr:hypothetical protein RvY_17676 [Ramazzottius varieornatus]
MAMEEVEEEVLTSPYTVKEMWERCPRGLWMEVLQKLDVVNCQRLTRRVHDVERTWWCNFLGVTSLDVVKTVVWDNKFPGLERRIGLDKVSTKNSTHCLLKHVKSLNRVLVGKLRDFQTARSGRRCVHLTTYERDPSPPSSPTFTLSWEYHWCNQ